jgi:hypothetical protein
MDMSAIAALEANCQAIRWLGSYQLPRLGALDFLHHTFEMSSSSLRAAEVRDKLTNSVATSKPDQQQYPCRHCNKFHDALSLLLRRVPHYTRDHRVRKAIPPAAPPSHDGAEGRNPQCSPASCTTFGWPRRALISSLSGGVDGIKPLRYGANLMAGYDVLAPEHMHLTGEEARARPVWQSPMSAARRRNSLKVQRIEPILTKDFPTKAKRPLNSRFDLTRLARVFGVTPPRWDEALVSELDVLARAFVKPVPG